MNDDFDRSGQKITIRVYTYENDRDVTEAYKEYKERYDQTFDGISRDGWAAWSLGTDDHSCHIHVVKMDRVRDKEMEIWGHELAHCVYGAFHDRGTR